MDSTARKAISNPADGLMVYDSTYKAFYYYSNAAWQTIGGSSNAAFEVSSNVVGPSVSVDIEKADFVFGSPQIDDDDDTDHESRFFFDKSKSAFRAGFADDLSWDEDSLGRGSAAFGENTRASGISSFAMGLSAVATERYATAIGNETSAKARSALAIGERAAATGKYAIALGLDATASGEDAIALGEDATATGESAIAIGKDMEAPSYGEIALGLYNTSYTPQSSDSFNAEDRLFSIGNGTNASGGRNDALVILKNGNAGLGTSTPDTTLHLVGQFKYNDGKQTEGYVLTSDANGNASWQSTSQDSLSDADGDTQIHLEASADENIIRFDTDGSERMIIDSLGNVGIGTTSPIQPLHIEVDENGLNLPLLLSNLDSDSHDNGVGIGFKMDGDNTGPKAAIFMEKTNTFGRGSLHILLNNEPDNDGVDLDNDVALTINRSGNVGIGTHDPAQPMHIEMDKNGLNFPILLGNVNGTISGGNGVGIAFASTSTHDNAKAGIFFEQTEDNGRGNMHFLLDNASDNNEVELSNVAVTFTNDGSVGIGTTAPEELLHIEVNNNGLNLPLLLRNLNTSTSTGDNGVGIGFNNTNITTDPKVAIFMKKTTTYGRGDLHILINNETNNDGADLSDAVATFTKKGYVGIGTTEPDTSLHLVGKFKYEDGTQSEGYILTSDADGKASWKSNIPNLSFTNDSLSIFDDTVDLSSLTLTSLSDADGDTKIQVEQTTGENIIRFNTDGSERMQIDSSGFVGIGTTSPAQSLHIEVDNDGINLPLLLRNLNNTTDDNGVGIGFNNNNNAATDPKIAIFMEKNGNAGRGDLHILVNNEPNTNGADLSDIVATFTKEGEVGIGYDDPSFTFQVGQTADGTIAIANAWATFSDRRWKKDFVVVPDALHKLDQVNGYYYHWKEGVDTTQQLGVVAQEIEAILPQCISTDEKGYKSVDYGKLTAFLIQVNKEQQAQIKALEAETQELKAEKEANNERLTRLELLLTEPTQVSRAPAQ